jgi:VanZ family protein
MAAIFASASVPELDTAEQGVNDKTAHLVAYGVLGLTFIRAFAGGRWAGVAGRAAGLAWLSSAVYGATDELHQAFVAGRTPSVLDWIADAAGAALAVVVTLAIAWWRRRKD